jgi:hypothetical protein
MRAYGDRHAGGVWISANGSTARELKNRVFSGALQLAAKKPLFFCFFYPNSSDFS